MRGRLTMLGIAIAALLVAPAAGDVPLGKSLLIAHHTANPGVDIPGVVPPNTGLVMPPCGRAGCDFLYQVIDHVTPVCGHAGPICECFAQPEFGTETWLAGPTPFVGGWANCAVLDPDGSTPWPVNHDLLVRAEFELCAGAQGVEIHVAIDNSIGVWVNGHRLIEATDLIGGACMAYSHSPEALCDTEFCAVYDRLKYAVPEWMLNASPGNTRNVIAFQACDHGYMSYFDFDVVADLSDEVCSDPCEVVSVSHDELWPPNHQFQEVEVAVGEGPEPVVATILSVFQDEEVRANKGDKCPDAMIAEDGLSALLRVERLGKPLSPGRIYHLGYQAVVEGVTCRGTAKVCVPHDQGAPDNCVDAGPLFDSTRCP